MLGRFFRWLRTRFGKKSQPPSDIFALTYQCAYQIFPKLSLGMPENFEAWRLEGSRPGAMFYLFACSVTGHQPNAKDGERFVWHSGKLSNGLDYVVVEYPRPEMATDPTIQIHRGSRLNVYYSAVIGAFTELAHREVYVLAQSPLAEITTLRRVTLAGHYNLGPGPTPDLDTLLAVLPTAASLEVRGGVILNRSMMTAIDEKLNENLQSYSPAEIGKILAENPDIDQAAMS